MSAGAYIPPSKCELRKVNQVQFEIWKEKQIKAHAACVVETAKSYHNGVPVRGGLSDLRMGTTDFKLKCETCNQAYNDCPGHFGMIELAEPMFNIGVFDIVLQSLKSVCKSCGTLLADRSHLDFAAAQTKKGSLRLREMVRLKKSKCHEHTDEHGVKRGCDATQPSCGRFLDIYPGLSVKVNFEDQEQKWYADRVYDIFDKISDEDARLMGFDPIRCHPRDLLITVLPVPPPHVRPSVAFGSAKSDNELTHKLNSILKENTELRKLKANHLDQTGIENVRIRLQEHIGTYFHNGSTYYKPSKMSDTAQLKSLTERLKGKYGRLRGNLMGKRVDFSARTVITGDPNIDVDEVGVPFSIAMTLTFPERVNAINKKRLTEFVRRPNYPSANYIIHENGQKVKLGMLKSRDKVNLKIGDVVERHVINGDVVLFNRQPTLHRMSMMGHRVRVLNYNTFRLNLSCTTPYNADFDGDEMNLHVPQSLLNKAELMEMMMVPKNFVSPNKSAPCMGIVQDSLLGCFRLTDKETFLDKIFVQSVAMWIDVWELPCPAILKPRPLWTGKQIFSLILPEVNIHNDESHRFSHEDKMLLIRRGQLLCGPIKKGIVGAAAGSLIHVIFNEKGSDEVARFINGVQRVTAFFLINFSFSVGVQDTMADPDTLHHINQVLVKAREEVRGIGACANMGTLQRKAGMTLLQSFEKDVNTALNKCRDDSAKKALSKVRRTNSFKCMIEAGSKGSDLNIQQIAVFVGQQNVGGQRIPFGFRRRTLPHFCLDDYGESSRGMATRGYVEGLKPHEFFFHTMAGREGLIDTAVKTADTGYLQRKLIKALEDVHAAYDGTVRNANQDIIQFMYGEDGLDGARIEGSQGFSLPMMSDAQLADTYRYEYTDQGEPTANLGGNYMDPHTKKMLRADPDNIKRLEEEYAQLRDDRSQCREILELTEKMKLSLPGNVERLIRNAQSTMGQRAKVSDLSPINIISEVRKLQEDLVQLFPSYNKGPNRMFLSEHSRHRIESALFLFNIHLRQMLGSKRVIKEYKLNSKAFEFLLSEIRAKYLQGIIHPGEMIGAMAAQSCGEPATQMTLNTFHNAGISSKNVTLGVPRLLELLNVSKNQKNTSMLITLKDGHNERAQAQKAQHRIEYCALEHLVRRLQIIYDPDILQSVIEEDREFIQSELDVHEDAQRYIEEARAASPWVLRLELDHSLMWDKRITAIDIRAAIRERFPDQYLIESSMSNVETDAPIVRIRPRVNLSNDAVPSLKSQIPEILGKIQLAGIKGVKKAILKELDTFKEDATGKMAKVKPWAIDTEGTALKQVFIGLIDNNTGHNIIDFAKTSSNKIPEVLQLLGIEAARYKMYLELREAYLAYGVVINYRHYMILVDTMCQRGYLMAVSRVGINRSDASGPLMRCSFEETVKVLMGAAAFGERDPVRGVSANIMLGNQARIGTGLFDLMIDLQALRSAVPQEDAIAPGREVNVYHGMASIELSSPSAPYPAGGGMYTPRATDASVFGRHGGAMPSASMPYAAGDFGSSQVYGNAMDFSTIASGAGMYDTAARSDPFTATSLRAGGSDVFIARNIDSAMPSVASDATFNFASSAPYSGGYGGNRSGMASVNLSPSYATASAYSPAASSVQNLSVGARYVPDMPSNNFQSGSHYSADSAKYASSVGSEQYLAESAPVAQREQDAYAPLGDEDEA
jgi:DNA-directed RNA polymerase II subunit RPB1